MTMTFSLHPTLTADTIAIGDLAHCRVLLMNNANFPWLILVPRREGLREIFELGDDYDGVMREVKMVAEKFAAHTNADKINVAALGNQVPQLHIHIIARYKTDICWPKPVWSSEIAPKTYTYETAKEITQTLWKIISKNFL